MSYINKMMNHEVVRLLSHLNKLNYLEILSRIEYIQVDLSKVEYNRARLRRFEYDQVRPRGDK